MDVLRPHVYSLRQIGIITPYSTTPSSRPVPILCSVRSTGGLPSIEWLKHHLNLAPSKVELTETARAMGEETAVAPHKGILREEVLALRQILGYTDYVDTSISLAVPDLGACIPGTRTKDALLVAIDVDVPQVYHKDNIDQLLLHVGCSILDTRKLPGIAVGADEPALPPELIVENHQFAIGDLKRREQAEKASKRFLFGKSEFIDRRQLQKRLEGLVSTRDFVTVFHSTKLDLEVLRDLGVDLPSRAAYVFDTNKVAQWPLQLHYRLSLAKLCHALDIPFALAHAAGNDAHFTLRALLMLAVKDADRLRHLHGCTTPTALLGGIQQIALAPRPISETEQSEQLMAVKYAKRRDVKRQDAERRDAKRQFAKQQDPETRLVEKLEKRALKQARKELRRDAGREADDASSLNEEAIRSGLFSEKYQEIYRFEQLPLAAKKQIAKERQEARMAQQQEEQTVGEQISKEADKPR